MPLVEKTISMWCRSQSPGCHELVTMREQFTGLVAVDAGGTSTRAVVVRPPGECLGYAVAGSGNPIAVGPETAAASVAASVMEALRRAGVPSTQIRLVVLAMAG